MFIVSRFGKTWRSEGAQRERGGRGYKHLAPNGQRRLFQRSNDDAGNVRAGGCSEVLV